MRREWTSSTLLRLHMMMHDNWSGANHHYLSHQPRRQVIHKWFTAWTPWSTAQVHAGLRCHNRLHFIACGIMPMITFVFIFIFVMCMWGLHARLVLSHVDVRTLPHGFAQHGIAPFPLSLAPDPLFSASRILDDGIEFMALQPVGVGQ